MKPQGLKVLKMLHIFFAFAWIVGALGMLIVVFSSDPQTGDELYMRSRILQIIDDYLVIGGASGSFLTGLVYGIWTSRGASRHHRLYVARPTARSNFTLGRARGPVNARASCG